MPSWRRSCSDRSTWRRRFRRGNGSLLEPNDRVGILIRKSLQLPRDVLGFTFSSNHQGLRGPCDPTAPTVVLGTSYAMGFSVDDGDNWYDGATFGDGALNLGLPVGLKEFEILFDELHTGPCETAVFLYHPNIWGHVSSYTNWRRSGQDAFEHFRWDKSLTGALERTARLIDTLRGDAIGRPVIAEIAGARYLLNPGYARFDLARGREAYEAGIAALLRILRRFRRVLVFRIPTKEELAMRDLDHAPLAALRRNHLDGWEYFRSRVVAELATCTVHEGDGFEMTDHLPCDTHWSRLGNAKMRDMLVGHGL